MGNGTSLGDVYRDVSGEGKERKQNRIWLFFVRVGLSMFLGPHWRAS